MDRIYDPVSLAKQLTASLAGRDWEDSRQADALRLRSAIYRRLISLGK